MLDEEERRASEEYIQRLLAEEQQLQEAQRRRHEDDERLARLISNQLVSDISSLREAETLATAPVRSPLMRCRTLLTPQQPQRRRSPPDGWTSRSLSSYLMMITFMKKL